MPSASQQPAAMAFEDGKRFAIGSLADVAVASRKRIARKGAGQILMFDYATGRVLDLNLAGTDSEIAARYWLKQAESEAEAAAPRGPGRPKLGVVAREVTLLPRHWEWLASQPGGASVALRKLVEVARRSSEVKDRVRQASAVAYRFMATIAGHEAGFEEASRALFAGDQAGFEALIAAWPVDVQNHLKALATDAFWA
jgi:hypothetical protein